MANNDIVLADEAMVSRHHAVIALEHGCHVLYDRDSANGTWVNGQRIFRHLLVPGDRVQIWQSEFVYKVRGEQTPQPVAKASPSPTPSVAGRYFDGYLLEELIGRGGMSEVFRARDPAGQTVAVKILQVTDPYLVTKFVQEGNEIGPLLTGHPNIVNVHKFDRSQDQRLYIVMEYVDGAPLRKLVGKDLSEARIVNIMGQVCSALALAHQNNIVHRDIKPENVLLTQEDTAKVLDFGIAKLTSASTVTRDKIVGTPEYISPEQAQGEPVCPGSDVYAVGIVLYELLTGSVPFPRQGHGDSFSAALAVIRQHLQERPEPPRKRNPNARIAPRLARIATKALEKDPRKRYSTAAEMGTALGYEAHRPARQGPARETHAFLAVLQGPSQGKEFGLVREAVTIGRQDLEPGNTSISRRHVSVLRRGDGYWLQDSSTNGTWVDSQRVYGEVPLTERSRIVIGNSVLRLKLS
jgi:serine/threonine protein kinase